MNAAAAAPRSPSLAARLGRLRETPGTAAIIVVCLAAYGWTAWKGDPTNGIDLLRFGASERSHVWRGEYWRLVTPMFLHGGVLHLGLNLFFGSSWNSAIERVLGTFRFLLLYLLAGVFASATSVLLHDAISVGASGAMFGMVGAVMALQYRRAGDFRTFAREPSVRSLVFGVALWIAIGFSGTRIDNWAHLGGLVYGGVLGYVLTEFVEPLPREAAPGEPPRVAPPAAPRERAEHWIQWAMALTVLGFVAAAACRRWPTQRAQIGALESLEAAQEAHEAGDLARARRDIDRAIGFDDSVPDVFVTRAALREEQGDLGGAIDDLDRALRVAPASWDRLEATHKALDALRGLARTRAASVTPPPEGSASATVTPVTPVTPPVAPSVAPSVAPAPSSAGSR